VDKTLRTIREEIRKNREGNVPLITLVVDTNILADYGWKSDEGVRHLFNTLTIDCYDDLPVDDPKVRGPDINRAAGSAWIEAGGGWEGLWSILRNYMGGCHDEYSRDH